MGFNLSWFGLSGAEQKLLIHLYSKERGLAFVEGSFNELAQAGYINKGKLYGEDGVRIAFFKTNNFKFKYSVILDSRVFLYYGNKKIIRST